MAEEANRRTYNRPVSQSGDPEAGNKELKPPLYGTEVSTYGHRPNIVPPYVLDKISQVHYKDQLNNSNVNANDVTSTVRSVHSKINDDDQYMSFANDPFVKSMNNNWHTFLHTVRQPTAYTDSQVRFDEDFTKTNKLDGTWGGDDRLKSALVGSTSSDEDTLVKEEFLGFLSSIFHRKQKHHDSDIPKVRSKAGYWMSDEKRADILPTLKRLFIQNPLVPLFLRILIAIFCLCALALACSIFVKSKKHYNGSEIEQQPSTIMAIVVQCFAFVYVVYIAYDEYNGKPMGLRNPLGKMKLIMLDLLFIIFSSANLSLAFNTLYDQEWVCEAFNGDERLVLSGVVPPTVSTMCHRQRALAAFLFLVDCLWVLTFTISIIRVIEKVTTVDPRTIKY